MIRFALGLIPATLLLIISPLFPKSKNGEFSITSKTVRKIAFWMVGLKEFR